MRAVIQRVRSASVTVDGNLVSKIGPGYLCLVGLREGDTQRDMEFVIKRILRTKAWPGEQGRPWDQSVVALGRELLLVSQFTLYGRLKNARPDYIQAREAWAQFVDLVKSTYSPDKVQDGVFGAMMDVELINDGPVTFIIDSSEMGGNASSQSLQGST